MSPHDIDTTTLAHRMLADYDAATPGTAFAEGLRLSVDDAWALAASVAALREDRGEQVVGYKVGCVDLGNRKSMGLEHPAWGRIWSTERHQDGAVLPKASYANPAMEAEFAIMLKQDLGPGEASPDQIIAAVGAVYPVIEIHNLVLRGRAPHGHELLANNAINAGVVVGDPIKDLESGTKTDLKLIYDDQIVDEWDVLTWPDDMLSAIGWLTEAQAKEGRVLKAGDLILTGAFGPPIPLEDRTEVKVTSSAFGDVTAKFV